MRKRVKISILHRENVIREIKEILEICGQFSIGEIEASCSPTVPNQKGNLAHLIECFNKETVSVEVWSNRTEESVDTYNLPYEELDTETLEEVLELCQTWHEIYLENDNF